MRLVLRALGSHPVVVKSARKFQIYCIDWTIQLLERGDIARAEKADETERELEELAQLLRSWIKDAAVVDQEKLRQTSDDLLHSLSQYGLAGVYWFVRYLKTGWSIGQASDIADWMLRLLPLLDHLPGAKDQLQNVKFVFDEARAKNVLVVID